jgi:Carboxypeptidase regulatory-like domain
MRRQSVSVMSRVVGLIVTVLPSIAFAQDSSGTVRGVVRNETGRPIEHALVLLEPAGANRQARTDREGRFSFLGVSPGQRTIRATFVGYRPNDRTVEVPRGTIDVEIILERAVTTLTGVEVTAKRSGLHGSVIAKDSLLPVPDARIEVLGARSSDTTDADGAFNFPKLKPGSYIVRVRHTRFESRNVSIVVPTEGATQLDLVVERGILSRDAHMEQLYREMDQRLQWKGLSSAMISREELKGLPTTGVDAALFAVPQVMKASFYPGREGWESACLFVDGVARPGARISDFAIEQIEAIEVYGPPMGRSDPSKTLESRWPPRAMCGIASGPRLAFEGGRADAKAAAGLSRSALPMQFVVIWLRR